MNKQTTSRGQGQSAQQSPPWEASVNEVFFVSSPSRPACRRRGIEIGTGPLRYDNQCGQIAAQSWEYLKSHGRQLIKPTTMLDMLTSTEYLPRETHATVYGRYR